MADWAAADWGAVDWVVVDWVVVDWVTVEWAMVEWAMVEWVPVGSSRQSAPHCRRNSRMRKPSLRRRGVERDDEPWACPHQLTRGGQSSRRLTR